MSPITQTILGGFAVLCATVSLTATISELRKRLRESKVDKEGPHP
jgi:hypothetical protein